MHAQTALQLLIAGTSNGSNIDLITDSFFRCAKKCNSIWKCMCCCKVKFVQLKTLIMCQRNVIIVIFSSKYGAKRSEIKNEEGCPIQTILLKFLYKVPPKYSSMHIKRYLFTLQGGPKNKPVKNRQ